MNEDQEKRVKAWVAEREAREAAQEVLFQKLKADCPRLWRSPEEEGWSPSPATPEAWDDLVYTLSVEIEKLLDSIEEIIPLSEMPYVLQCKEKFGSLRIYLSNYPEPISDKLEDLILDAENESSKICLKCKATDTTQIRSMFPPPFEKQHFGYISPLCDDCFMETAISRAKRSGIKEMRKWHYEQMALRKASSKKENE